MTGYTQLAIQHTCTCYLFVTRHELHISISVSVAIEQLLLLRQTVIHNSFVLIGNYHKVTCIKSYLIIINLKLSIYYWLCIHTHPSTDTIKYLILFTPLVK